MASQVQNVTCPACAKNFTQPGFQKHLRQTKDPHCTALYAEMVDMELTHIADQEAPKSHEHQPFEGDVFGGPDNYIYDDFGQLDASDPEDDDEQEEQARFESEWEPERPGARAASLQTNEDTNEERPTQQAQAGDHDEPVIHTSRSQVEGRIADSHIVVRYSDKYPDQQAGAPMKKLQSGDDNYSAALDNSSNPWAPFSSQMDWEIAKWAKLRGAGSTAFSDLLAIEGVSIYCVSGCCNYSHTDISIFQGSRSTQVIIQ